jgi:hypothetical protein
VTLLPASSDRNPLPGSGRPPLLTQRAAIIFTPALVAGVAVGILAAFGSAQAASAILSGGAACGGVLALLNKIIG